MTTQENDLIRSAIEILSRLLPQSRPKTDEFAGSGCPVAIFVKRFLERDLSSAMTSVELWGCFRDVASLGEVETLSKSEFFRRLPGAMAMVFGLRKSHNIRSKTGHVRGFRGISVREIELPPDCV